MEQFVRNKISAPKAARYIDALRHTAMTVSAVMPGLSKMSNTFNDHKTPLGIIREAAVLKYIGSGYDENPGCWQSVIKIPQNKHSHVIVDMYCDAISLGIQKVPAETSQILIYPSRNGRSKPYISTKPWMSVNGLSRNLEQNIAYESHCAHDRMETSFAERTMDDLMRILFFSSDPSTWTGSALSRDIRRILDGLIRLREDLLRSATGDKSELLIPSLPPTDPTAIEPFLYATEDLNNMTGNELSTLFSAHAEELETMVSIWHEVVNPVLSFCRERSFYSDARRDDSLNTMICSGDIFGDSMIGDVLLPSVSSHFSARDAANMRALLEKVKRTHVPGKNVLLYLQAVAFFYEIGRRSRCVGIETMTELMESHFDDALVEVFRYERAVRKLFAPELLVAAV